MQKRTKKHNQRGLTLTELLVSVFIMGLMVSVVAYNHRNFSDNLEITNLAYAVALSVREAQIAGISVRPNPEDEFDSAFGVHFNVGTGSGFEGNNQAFLTFADLDANSEYNLAGSYPGFDCDDPSNTECVSVTEMGRNNFISRICYRGSGVNMVCAPNIKGVDITFLRPKPDAITRFRNSGGSVVSSHDNKEAIICLESPQGRKRSVHILKTGQISVRQESCNPQGGGSL